jgi:hypothetical protein
MTMPVYGRVDEPLSLPACLSLSVYLYEFVYLKFVVALLPVGLCFCLSSCMPYSLSARTSTTAGLSHEMPAYQNPCLYLHLFVRFISLLNCLPS